MLNCWMERAESRRIGLMDSRLLRGYIEMFCMRKELASGAILRGPNSPRSILGAFNRPAMATDFPPVADFFMLVGYVTHPVGTCMLPRSIPVSKRPPCAIGDVRTTQSTTHYLVRLMPRASNPTNHVACLPREIPEQKWWGMAYLLLLEFGSHLSVW